MARRLQGTHGLASDTACLMAALSEESIPQPWKRGCLNLGVAPTKFASYAPCANQNCAELLTSSVFVSGRLRESYAQQLAAAEVEIRHFESDERCWTRPLKDIAQFIADLDANRSGPSGEAGAVAPKCEPGFAQHFRHVLALNALNIRRHSMKLRHIAR